MNTLKGKLPEKSLLPAQPYSPNNHTELTEEKMRAKACWGLMQLAENHCDVESPVVEHYLHLMEVRCKVQVLKKGDLTLSPCTTMAKIVSTASNCTTLGSQYITCKSCGGILYIAQPSKM